MDEFGIAQAQPVVNPTAGKIANFLRKAKEFGNQYEVKDYVPLFGGTGIGDLFLGQAPEEVNRWSYGDYPFRNPSSVVGTGGNRLDVWKTGRFEPTFDVVANVALPAVGTAQMTAKPLARALAPKAAEMAESYLTKTGAIANITEPSPVKIAEALRQPPKNELGFYSPLDEAVMNLQNPKGTGQQYLAQLLKTQGVKQEEVSTRGLDTFLAENPKVTKTQIEEFLAENPVNIKETVLGQRESYDPKRLTQLENEWSNLKEHAIDDPSFGENKYDEMIKLQNIRDNSTVESLYRDHDLYIKRGQYQQKQGNKAEADKFFRQAELLNTRAEKLDLQGLGPTTPTKFGAEQFNIPNGKNYREVLIQLPSERMDIMEAAKQHYKTFIQKGGEPNFDRLPYEKQMEIVNTMPNEAKNVSSKGEFVNMSHFEQPNILAHMRVDDRVIDGKKTLFIQEIQSDWHQAGRKKGYNEPKALAEIQKQRQILLDKKDYYAKLAEPYAAQGKDSPPDVVEGWTLAANGLQELDKKQSALGRAVPDAPFKNTEQWAGLAMKRAMQMAAEGGYDRVAFTTGKQQADRYNLRKSVEELHYSGSDLVAYDGSGNKVISQTGVRPEDLPDLVGKEAAEKLLNQPKQGTLQSLTGQDLEVGGEGMKGFYDKILPDLVNKYGKKHGLRVGKTQIPVGKSRDANGIPSMYDQKEDVHYFDLTPEAKTSFLSKGQPLFAVPPAMAITDEDSRRDMLEKLFNNQK